MAEFEKTLERYDVVDRIAIGGMAEVFLAKAYGAHGFEKTLAIKRILPDLARDPEFEERFIAEAKVAVKLSHTNIVQVFDFGRFAQSLFIAMEYVDGLDLAALLRRHRDRGELVPVAAAFQIAIELTRGLDYAHQHGVVHRDVSPSNILLSRAGEVKIADFGIAVAARPNRAVVGSGPRKVMGKWRYMSPEQARGESLDTHSDLFSAAAVMFELFTGQKLFPGDEAEDIIRNIQHMPLPRAADLRPGLPARLDEILHGALARDPSQRPVRAALMLRALTELSYESSIVASTLDVAEAVATSVEPGTSARTAVDDQIRKQLLGLPGEGSMRRTAVTDEKRRTAVETQPGGAAASLAGVDTTGVFRHLIDDDGLSRLEVDAQTVVARKNKTAPLPVITDGGAPSGTARRDAEALDPDRRTEVGPPLVDSRPFDRDHLRDLAAEVTPTPPRSPTAVREAVPATPRTDVAVAPGPVPAGLASRRGLAIAAVAVAGLATGLTAWLLRDPPVARAPVVVAPVVIDAAPAPRTGTLVIRSVPAGAEVKVDGEVIGQTQAEPAEALAWAVPADRAVTVTLELAGYQRFVRERLTVTAGERYSVEAALLPAKARLRVTSAPDGANVSLAGRPLGTTPVLRDDLDAGTQLLLELRAPGFEPSASRITLIAGDETKRHVDLKPATQMGAIQLNIEGGWAQVYLRGKLVGRAPIKHLELPVGVHTLRLHNPVSNAEKQVMVTVHATDVRYYSFAL